MRAKAEELTRKAEVLRAEGRENEALLHLQVIEENFRPEWRPDRAIQIREKTLSQKLKVSDFRPLTEWPRPLRNDIRSRIFTIIQETPCLMYAEIKNKGQAFYNGKFLEYTLPNTKPLPTEIVDLVKQRGSEEYSERIEKKLMSQVRPPYEEVSAFAVIEDKPEIVVLKTKKNNMVAVERICFEYLFERYNKIRAFDNSKPILFYESSFVHGYLWPVNV
jgi:hypothetical protein